MRTATAIVFAMGAMSAGFAFARLPAQTDDAKAKAQEAAAKTAWTDKVAAFKLCQVQDQVAAKYRQSATAAGKPPAAPVSTPPCVDPGPFGAPTPLASKPLEASEAHSPPGNAAHPPSQQATHAEIQGGIKKK